mmetsp:Transcript_9580/g.23495  ORF Transcript_9580/g.23495 Transcript_9580/m.23495 type:complete len:239 (+) Transcript_9580:1587-2303(+)
MTLLRVQIIQFLLVCTRERLQYLIELFDFLLVALFLQEDLVHFHALGVVLGFEQLIHVLDLLGPRVGALLVQREIVVGEFPLQVAHLLDQLLVPFFEHGERVVIVLDFHHFLVELLQRVAQLVVLLAQLRHVVGLVVNLPAGLVLALLHVHTHLRQRPVLHANIRDKPNPGSLTHRSRTHSHGGGAHALPAHPPGSWHPRARHPAGSSGATHAAPGTLHAARLRPDAVHLYIFEGFKH